ncbi:hypothetical protein MUU74_08090 [Chryseobacterium daecheongense]|uniref:hypothetical protein n=1 Tax=Chryseobacterium daecheongense TaxID=192389 RepID=UPI001FD675CA|nr:hypothetical protein [Chryseobacterium daecheongense]UOU99901.1 hypothetical protein MUU74_08090 [Chryseobacterium daecheongense]
MKNYLTILGIVFMMNPFFIKAQTGNIGIATTKPRTHLDVNGTMNVKNDIKLGGTDLNSGNSGTFGDLISANGNNNPEWRNFDLPEGYGNSLVLNATYLMSSETGVSFAGTGNSAVLSVPYTQDQGMTTPTAWKEITGIAQTFAITKTISSTNISLQTLAQSNSDVLTSFGCGIYIDDKLKFVRTASITGVAGSYRTLNLNASISNLSIGNHTFRFACVERNISNGITVSIGQPTVTTNLNNKMAATAASIKVYEPMN